MKHQDVDKLKGMPITGIGIGPIAVHIEFYEENDKGQDSFVHRLIIDTNLEVKLSQQTKASEKLFTGEVKTDDEEFENVCKLWPLYGCAPSEVNSNKPGLTIKFHEGSELIISGEAKKNTWGDIWWIHTYNPKIIE